MYIELHNPKDISYNILTYLGTLLDQLFYEIGLKNEVTYMKVTGFSAHKCLIFSFQVLITQKLISLLFEHRMVKRITL